MKQQQQNHCQREAADSTRDWGGALIKYTGQIFVV